MKVQRNKYTWLALSCLLIIVTINLVLVKLNKKARNEITFYQSELIKLEDSSEIIEELRDSRAQLIEYMQVAKSIEISRVAAVRILNLIVSRWPQEAKLKKFRLSGNQVVLYLENISSAKLNSFCQKLKNVYVNCSISTKQRTELSNSGGSLIVYYDDEMGDFINRNSEAEIVN